MSLLLLLTGYPTATVAVPPAPPVIAVATGGPLTFVPSKKRRPRVLVPDVLRPPNYIEMIDLEDEEVVLLL